MTIRLFSCPALLCLCAQLACPRCLIRRCACWQRRCRACACFPLPDQALCALAEEVPSVIAGNDRLLASLFRAVSVQPPLDCVRAGYFARLVGTLLTRCGEDLLAFLEVGEPCSPLPQAFSHCLSTPCVYAISEANMQIAFCCPQTL